MYDPEPVDTESAAFWAALKGSGGNAFEEFGWTLI
jgi:hypothetical protein